jgi:hypothetical protein
MLEPVFRISSKFKKVFSSQIREEKEQRRERRKRQKYLDF